MASDIVIADAAGTPVNHTFKPLGVDAKGVYWWVDQSQANPLGYWKISAEVTRPANPRPGDSATNRVYRVKVALHEPVLANITNSTVTGVAPAPTLAYTPRSHQEFIIPESATLLDRQNIAKMTPLLAQNTQIKSLVESLAYPGL